LACQPKLGTGSEKPTLALRARLGNLPVTLERRLVDGRRIELLTSALRTLAVARVISLVRLNIADASPDDVPMSLSRAKPHSSAGCCGTDGHKSGHIGSSTYGDWLAAGGG
jgi:hypothetical protein